MQIVSHYRPRSIALVSAAFLFWALLSTSSAASSELPFTGNKGSSLASIDAKSSGITRNPALTEDANPVINSGLAAGDFDGDGKPDLFFCDYDGDSRLFRNEGDWRFSDATGNAKLNLDHQQCVGATFADVDGDRDLDLFVLTLSTGEWLYRNQGDGTFAPGEKLPRSTNEADGGASTATLADVDGDGDLDLYLSRYRSKLVRNVMRPSKLAQFTNEQLGRFRSGLPLDPEFKRYFRIEVVRKGGIVRARVNERGIRDDLYLNDGMGNFTIANAATHFSPSSDSAELALEGFGLTAQFRDADRDGDPDLFVCNDFFTPDRFWINDGKGRFSEATAKTLRRISYYSMGVDFSDINRDGHLDFITVDMLSRRHDRRKIQMGGMTPTPIAIGEILNRPQIMQNALFLNRGDNTYAEIAQYSGLKASEWSWSSVFADIDLDGYEDLLVTTGMARDFMDSDTKNKVEKMNFTSDQEFFATRQLFPRLPTANFVFLNRGDMRFDDRSAGLGIQREAVSGGLALADFDGDGDLDLAINNMGAPPELYRNDAGNNRVAVRLQGKAPNTQATGATVTLEGADEVQIREVLAGGRYASGCDTLQVFGIPDAKPSLRLAVTWPDGRETVLNDIKPNRLYEIHQESSLASPSPNAHVKPPTQTSTWFEDVSHRLNHRHTETPFDDFKSQPLLPNRLSQLGPGVGWIDLDADGDDDILIGAGARGQMAAFINDGKGAFTPNPAPMIPVDQSGVAAWSGGRALVGISNQETASSEHASVQAFGLKNRSDWDFGQGLAGSPASTGPLATGDIDGDGDLDLFVGGRAIPGRYPTAAQSRIFLNQDGKLRPDESNADLLHQLGMVSGATLGDIDDDGDPDLILALEWGPVTLLRNEAGRFQDATRDAGLASRAGWWNSVALGDFDNDGRPDIVAGNWGLNSKYEHSYGPLQPLRIYHGDFDGTGAYDVVEAHFDRTMNCLVPERGFSCSSRAMPFIRSRRPTYRDFATSALEGIYGPSFRNAKEVRANTLAHTVFLNRGRTFEARQLPLWSQLAPVTGISVADFDGDGNEDLFLAQNFFAVQVETPRNDGGRGLILKGDGTGTFQPIKGHESGVAIYGEQRGCATTDMDGDGRTDLLVSQNGAETRLYRNLTGRSGFRIRLSGPEGNPAGIGSILRLEFGNGKLGPARVICGGSGYWSQETLTPVMAPPAGQEALKLHVIWPHGKKTQHSIDGRSNDLVVRLRE